MGLLIQPMAPHHELFPETADMSDRSAETGLSKFGEDAHNLQRRTRPAIACSADGAVIFMGASFH